MSNKRVVCWFISHRLREIQRWGVVGYYRCDRCGAERMKVDPWPDEQQRSRSPCSRGRLCGTINAPRRFFPAADVGDFLEHVINRAHIDHIGRCDLMLKLAGPSTQPNINSFFKRELGFAWIVLNDAFSQVRLLWWLGRCESVSVEGPRKAEPALRKCARLFHVCNLRSMQITQSMKRRKSPKCKLTTLCFPCFAWKFFDARCLRNTSVFLAKGNTF